MSVRAVVEFTREEKVETYLALQAWIAVLEEREQNLRPGSEYKPDIAQAVKAAVRAKIKVDASIGSHIEEGITEGGK